MKTNFTQALKELTGFDNPAEGTEASFREPEFKETFQEEHSVSAEIFSSGEAESTHISESMVVKGEIRSEDDIRVDGQVYGDITTAGNLVSTSLIIGDIEAMNANLLTSHTKGNLSLEGHLDVGAGSVLVGDVAADSVKISGKVKGNLDIRSSILLSQSALVSGDIVTDSIAAEPGSRINGTVSTRGDELDLNAEFDFGGEF